MTTRIGIAARAHDYLAVVVCVCADHIVMNLPKLYATSVLPPSLARLITRHGDSRATYLALALLLPCDIA